ncbi:hypothetical protein KCU85_g64, partial [Aureobasidium melanogenum]
MNFSIRNVRHNSPALFGSEVMPLLNAVKNVSAKFTVQQRHYLRELTASELEMIACSKMDACERAGLE